MSASYTGNFSSEVSFWLATSAWGWHLETGNACAEVILSGALDRFPKLQLILGHQGEVIPFLLPKLEMAFPQERTGLERQLRDYFHQNFHFTFGVGTGPRCSTPYSERCRPTASSRL